MTLGVAPACFTWFEFNVLTLAQDGIENEMTDDFRDFVFRYGLRFYSKRPFKSLG